MQLSLLVLSLLGTVSLCPWSVTADGGCGLSFLRTLTFLYAVIDQSALLRWWQWITSLLRFHPAYVWSAIRRWRREPFGVEKGVIGWSGYDRPRVG